eukprot:3479663-Karenia_brevis.AAC.1
MESGIQGISFTPFVAQGQEQSAASVASMDGGGGGAKRDSSPTPQEQAPRPKEPKTDGPS